jgi:5'-3' exonuclease
MMDVHLINGTYELFRRFFAVPTASDVSGQKIGAVRGVLTSVLSMIERGATHIGVATDDVVESFRNDLYSGYKTSEGVPQELLSQFPTLEEAMIRCSRKPTPDTAGTCFAQPSVSSNRVPAYHLTYSNPKDQLLVRV